MSLVVFVRVPMEGLAASVNVRVGVGFALPVAASLKVRVGVLLALAVAASLKVRVPVVSLLEGEEVPEEEMLDVAEKVPWQG